MINKKWRFVRANHSAPVCFLLTSVNAQAHVTYRSDSVWFFSYLSIDSAIFDIDDLIGWELSLLYHHCVPCNYIIRFENKQTNLVKLWTYSVRLVLCRADSGRFASGLHFFLLTTHLDKQISQTTAWSSRRGHLVTYHSVYSYLCVILQTYELLETTA